MDSALMNARFQRRRAFFRRLKLYGLASTTALLVVGSGYLVMYSSLFRISAFSVVSETPVDEQAVITTLKQQIAARPLGGVLGPDNYFSWPRDMAYQELRLSGVKITKSFWDHEIVISTIPRQRYAAWCADQETITDCAWVDENGIAFEVSPISEGQLVQTIYDADSGSLAVLGDPVIAPEEFAVVRKVLDGVRRINLGVSRITVNRKLQELELQTFAGTRVFFSTRFDPEPAALPAVSRFVANPGLLHLEYINLTVENRAFTKQR